jgi:site-specific DNA-cytosine methylase
MDRLKKLDEQQAKIEQERQELQTQAHDEARQAVEAALAELNGLGYTYRLVEGAATKSIGKAKTAKASGSTSGKGVMASDKVCPICNFRTDPPHDGRRHKGKQRRPFTAEELASEGLTKSAD